MMLMLHCLQLPAVQPTTVNDYLTQLGTDRNAGNKLYMAGFVVYVRATAVYAQSLFVHDQCAAEMRKGVSYVVDIHLSDSGNVLAAQCECAAGVGPTAHCKHIQAILCAIIDLTMNGNLRLRLVCTQKIQSFHKSKIFLGSPVKAQALPLGHARVESSSSSTSNSNEKVYL